MFDADGANSGTITEESTVSVKELSTLFGISTRRVRQLAEDEVVVRAERGRYALTDSVQGYVAFMTKPTESEDDLKLEKDRRKAELTLKEAKAKVAMLHAKEMEGEMHRSEDVKRYVQSLVNTIKSALLSLPGRCAVELSLQETAEECQVILKSTVKDILSELSEFKYDPAYYESMVRERENMNEAYENEERNEET